MKKQTAMVNVIRTFLMAVMLGLFSAGSALTQTTTFTYQGKLNDGAGAANGSYLLRFTLFDAQSVGTGTQIGTPLSDIPATVANGIFTVQLDFGGTAFNGTDRFLEISVRRNPSESYVTLTPRQPVSSVPYAIKSKTAETAGTATNAINAANATNADTLDGIDSTGFVPTNTTLFIRNQTNQQTANFNVNGTGTASILNAATQYNLSGTRIFSAPGTLSNLFVGVNTGDSNPTGGSNSVFGYGTGKNITGGNFNSFFGADAGAFTSGGDWNSFLGASSGSNNTTGSNNSFVGLDAGSNNTTGSNNTIIGSDANVILNNLSYATAIGSDATVGASNTIALGRSNGADRVLAYGLLQVNTLATAGTTSLCRNASNQISTCSSSLRYKTNINPFDTGLSIINRLKPITFDWKDGGMKDLGLGAEDVAAVYENLIIRNEKGEVEGVKYDRIGVVLINAVKEQQRQIETQQKLILQQGAQIELLRQLVCSQNPNAGICKEEK